MAERAAHDAAARVGALSPAGRLARAFVESKITALIMLALSLAGVLALLVTPREYNPKIVVPAANIIVTKPGASPGEVLRLVVRPLEAIMASMSGVDHTFGYAANDYGVVTVQFKVGQDQERSLVKMYNQLMQNLDRIPPGASQPVVKPIDVDDVPVLTVTLSSKRMDGTQLREVGQKLLVQLRGVPGVSFSEVVGGAPRAVEVWISPARLAASGVSLQQLEQVLRASNLASPLGQVVDGDRVTPVRLDSLVGGAHELSELMIGAPGGKPVYLKDVARVEDGPAEVDELSHFSWGPASHGHDVGAERSAVTLAIAKKAGTNAVVVTNAVLRRLDQVRAWALPEGVEVTVTRNDGAKADEAVDTLIEHLGVAIVSVSLLLWLFLGWREAGIVTLTVPLILCAVLAVDLMIGQSINRITLFALILALGLLVDDSVVVIENIHRHMHAPHADSFVDVVVRATDEIGSPTNMATLAVILAFVPMAFVTGMMGPFMRPIPINVPVAMGTSLLMAYTVVPWAARRWLADKASRHVARARDGAPPRDFLQAAYLRLFTPLLRRRGARNLLFAAVLLGLVGAVGMPAWQFLRPAGMNAPLAALGVELRMLPFDDTNSFLLEVDTPAGSPIEFTDEVARACAQVVARQPEVVDWQTFVGRAAPLDFAALVRGDSLARGDELAQMRIDLLPKSERSRSSHAIVQDLWRRLAPVRARFAGTRIKLFETPPGPPVRSQVSAELFGPDYAQLRAIAPRVLDAFDGTYGMINQDDSVAAASAEYEVRLDTRKAALAGITPGQVARLLHSLVAGVRVGAIHARGALEPVDIDLRVERAGRQQVGQLLDLPLRTADGAVVPLRSFASVEAVARRQPIYTRDQHPVVYVSGEMLGASPVYATLSLNSRLDGARLAPGAVLHTGNLGFVPTPPEGLRHVQLLWGGEMRLTLDVFRDLGSAFLVALLFIDLLLVAYYRSFVLPLIVMGSIPLTLLGVFPGHWITHQPFTATSMIGVIALAGVVVRNSLLLIDFILDYRARGWDLEQAVAQAGAVRLRPILLTALAIVFGSSVMITDPVFGGLAVSLVFGTLVSTLLTLVVIPLLYFLWSRRAQPAVPS